MNKLHGANAVAGRNQRVLFRLLGGQTDSADSPVRVLFRLEGVLFVNHLELLIRIRGYFAYSKGNSTDPDYVACFQYIVLLGWLNYLRMGIFI